MLSKLRPLTHFTFMLSFALLGACTSTTTADGPHTAGATASANRADRQLPTAKAGTGAPPKDEPGASENSEMAGSSGKSADTGEATPTDEAAKTTQEAGTGGKGGTGETHAEGGAYAAGNGGPAGRGAVQPSTCDAITQVDLLFVVDNSNSMTAEQQALKQQFPTIVQALTNGRRPGISARSFPPVTDIHVGVVSTDMGIPGVEFPSGNCHADGGDDGKFQTIPHGDTCDLSYPRFLTYNGDARLGPKTDAAKFANDVACIATVGTGGCGFEQQLEAPLKALWPKVQRDASGNEVNPNELRFLATTDQGTWGRGDVPVAMGGNEGFLRNGTDQSGPSLLAIVLLTDEEDCSVRSTEHLKPNNQLPETSPIRMEDINLRCYLHKELLYNVAERYYAGFRKLRPGHEERVVFTAIAGVPADLVDETARAKVDFSSDDASTRDAFYEKILNDPRMQETLDPATSPGTGMGNLQPSCFRQVPNESYPSTAYPPRRIVELAKLFGKNGMIQSICQDDFSSASAAIVDTLARRLERPCH